MPAAALQALADSKFEFRYHFGSPTSLVTIFPALTADDLLDKVINYNFDFQEL